MERSQGPNSSEGSPEVDGGGADSVQKTSYVTGRGTEPEGRSQGRPIAQVGTGGGFGWGGLIVAVLVIAIAAIYAMGFFR